MQDPKSSHTRKPWYRRATSMATLWKSVSKSHEYVNETLRKTIFKASGNNNNSNDNFTANITCSNNNRKLRKCTSMRVATSFTRVCLCAPISSYTEVFQVDHHHNYLNNPPRRSYTYPRTTSNNNFPSKTSQDHHHLHHSSSSSNLSSARVSLDCNRKIFRGKSLTEDVLMRRFVVEEEAMMQELRRKNEMEIIRRRISGLRKKKVIGPSPLRRMALAHDQED